MSPIEGRPILTAAAMRAAEARAIAAGSGIETLMERAGAGVAQAVHRLAAGASVLILCGPGNNGGDGYVAARVLKDNGADVRVAATGDPISAAAARARARWGGPVDTFASFAPPSVMVDAVFGTGLTRPLADDVRQGLGRAMGARLSIAVDLPSGVETDTGAVWSDIGRFDVTLALGAVKPAHVLYPAAEICGAVRLLDIGVEADGDDLVLGAPWLPPPAHDAQKYSRGMVAVIAGAMPGAAALSAEAALRAGAGYALLVADEASPTPHAVVRRGWSAGVLNDRRIGAVVIGPGLGRDDAAREKLRAAIDSAHPLVIDGDALHLLEPAHFEHFHAREQIVVLTPHGGEFTAMFGAWSGSKIEATRRAAARSGAWVVFKGPDTVMAMPSRSGRGDVRVATGASPWLSTAGTGDVLTGAIAAMLPGKGAPLHRIGAGVWLHAEAARRLGGAFIADDLVRELSAVRAAL